MSINRCENIRFDVLHKIESAMSKASYQDTIENSSQYNNRLVIERKGRLPFIDSQTGVAQNNCFLWMQKWERMPGMVQGQVYSYPERRWKKKRRGYLINDQYMKRCVNNSSPSNLTINQSENELNKMVGIENSLKVENNPDSNDKLFENSKDNFFQDFETGSDIPDAGELEEESDYDEYEEYGSRRRKRRGYISRRKKSEHKDSEKPFTCDICGMKYKTRGGLNYHFSHTHSSDPECKLNRGPLGSLSNEEETGYNPPRQISQQSSFSALNQQLSTGPSASDLPNVSNNVNHISSFSSNGSSRQQLNIIANFFSTTSSKTIQPSLDTVSKLNGPFYNSNPSNHNSGLIEAENKSQNSLQLNSLLTFSDDSNEVKEKNTKKLAVPNSYCDFCLGGNGENKRTKMAENLISCSDCGRSAHPSCLQVTPNIIIAVQKYRWQCIECKSCGICGTSDNDEQLLFCDDCDRGYHMYCLNPPLSEPPEGSWSCHLCVLEYHTPQN